jgi:hypothetical protein
VARGCAIEVITFSLTKMTTAPKLEFEKQEGKSKENQKNSENDKTTSTQTDGDDGPPDLELAPSNAHKPTSSHEIRDTLNGEASVLPVLPTFTQLPSDRHAIQRPTARVSRRQRDAALAHANINKYLHSRKKARKDSKVVSNVTKFEASLLQERKATNELECRLGELRRMCENSEPARTGDTSDDSIPKNELVVEKVKAVDRPGASDVDRGSNEIESEQGESIQCDVRLPSSKPGLAGSMTSDEVVCDDDVHGHTNIEMNVLDSKDDRVEESVPGTSQNAKQGHHQSDESGRTGKSED